MRQMLAFFCPSQWMMQISQGNLKKRIIRGFFVSKSAGNGSNGRARYFLPMATPRFCR
jgi:hypothetical protein